MEEPEYITTEVFAALHGVKPRSVRAHYYQHGSYFGIKPQKMANRMLMWPNQRAVELLHIPEFLKKVPGDGQG